MEIVVPLLLKLLMGVLHGCHFHEEFNHINTYRRFFFLFLDRAFSKLKKRTNQQNAQINFVLINLLLFNHSNMFRPLNRSHHQGVQNP